MFRKILKKGLKLGTEGTTDEKPYRQDRARPMKNGTPL